jgi:hypothetical protein
MATDTYRVQENPLANGTRSFWTSLRVYWQMSANGTVPDHDGGRPMEVNACILITHMFYL